MREYRDYPWLRPLMLAGFGLVVGTFVVRGAVWLIGAL